VSGAFRIVWLVIVGAVYVVFLAFIADLAVGFSIAAFCNPEGGGLLSMHSSTCRVIGEDEGNDVRTLIDASAALIGALAGILLVVSGARRKNVR